MTITNTLVKTVFPGDGTAAIRTTTFVLGELAQLRVVLVDSLGVETTLVSPTHYSAVFTSTAPATLQITPAAVIPVGDTWYAYRNVDRTQVLDYTAADLFPAESHEAGLDRLTMIAQELYFQVQRSLRTAVQDSDVDMTIPRLADRLGKIAGYDPATGASVVYDVSVFVPGALPVGSVGELLLAVGADPAAQTLLSYVRNTANVKTLGAGAIGARPASWSFGDFGPYIATDTGELSYFNGAWNEFGGGARRGTLAARPAAATVGSKYYHAEDVGNFYRSDGATWALRRVLSPGTLNGLQLSWLAATTLGVTAGQARSDDDDISMILAANTIKTFNPAGQWSAGAGGNMRPTATTNVDGTTYYVFAIGRSDNGALDFGIDHDSAAINLLAAASAVTGATWNRKRRIGFVFNDSATSLHRFFQDGDEFLHFTAKNGYIDAGTADYATAGQTRTLAYSAPRCVNRGATMWQSVGTANAIGVLNSPQQVSAAPLMTGTPGAMFREAATESLMSWNLYVDSNSQVHFRSQAASDVATSLRVIVHGWTDRRGKDA